MFNRSFLVFIIFSIFISGCSINNEEYMDNLNRKNHQYHIYDSATKSLIFDSAYELEYDSDNDEYSMFIYVPKNDITKNEYTYEKFYFNRSDIIIIDSESGNKVNFWSIKWVVFILLEIFMLNLSI